MAAPFPGLEECNCAVQGAGLCWSACGARASRFYAFLPEAGGPALAVAGRCGEHLIPEADFWGTFSHDHVACYVREVLYGEAAAMEVHRA